MNRKPTEPSGLLAGCLVLLQFASAALLVLSGRSITEHPLLLVIAAAAALLGVWAWLTIGLRRISVMPRANDQTRLVASGPYRWIRHPMYTATALFCGAFVPAPFQPWKLAIWLLLIGVLAAKSHWEERSMASRFPEYEDYRARTWRFVPGLY